MKKKTKRGEKAGKKNREGGELQRKIRHKGARTKEARGRVKSLCKSTFRRCQWKTREKKERETEKLKETSKFSSSAASPEFI